MCNEPTHRPVSFTHMSPVKVPPEPGNGEHADCSPDSLMTLPGFVPLGYVRLILILCTSP
jgi:hypothetical protein